MAIAGHVSPRMLAHYSHVRLQAKRKALEALSRRPAGQGSGDGYGTKNVTNPASEPSSNPQVIEKMVDVAGLEPATPCLQSRCSPN